MSSPVTFIKKDGRPTHAVLPIKTYRQMLDELDELAAIQIYDRYKAAPPSETFPASLVHALLDGGNPVRLWRKYRRLTQAQLAKRCGIAIPYLSQIEMGRRQPSSAVLKRLALALGVAMDDLA